MQKKGSVSVQTEHLFPIIKKWLYSDKDIFLRELVSNACDAVTKLRHLSAIGEAQGINDDFSVNVLLDKDAGTLTVSDNGIGMSADEVSKYINQIALSGALDFIQKYEGENESVSKDGIIGHFGLGFYSSFMVADTVDIITKSYTDAPSCKWTGNDEGDYEMSDADRGSRGTDIVLHINEDEKEYLDRDRIKKVLEKYCSFMPVKIVFSVKGEKDTVTVNETEPLWQKHPSQCTEEEYADFYKKVFSDFREPLFHIHINADYPLDFKGILYFPKPGHEYENLEGQVKLYYNRVFVADNIKEVIPEYLIMLKGVLDCPQLPLNVSRSYLQSDAYVKKVSAHIAKKVCDKLVSMHDTMPDDYRKMWDDLKIFVEYACLKDQKFYDKVKSAVLFKTVSDEYVSLDEYLEKRDDKKVYYTTDTTSQALYINAFKSENIEVLVMDNVIDANFIQFLEQTEKDVRFLRVDADSEALKENSETSGNEILEKIFRDVSQNSSLKVICSSLKDENIPALLNLSEDQRRFSDMMKMYAVYNKTSAADMPQETTLVLNMRNKLMQKLSQISENPTDTEKLLAKQIYCLSLLANRQFTADELNEFLTESYSVLGRLI